VESAVLLNKAIIQVNALSREAFTVVIAHPNPFNVLDDETADSVELNGRRVVCVVGDNPTNDSHA